MSDKRSMATDALETLGTAPLDDTAKRDAIHLAVMPAIAGESLRPGDHVHIRDGTAFLTDPGQGLGIVDPFIARRLCPGERFWLVLYPRTIKSLRHVWSHPAFPDEPGINPGVAQAVADISKRAESERWLIRFCNESPGAPSYERTMAAIGDSLDGDLEYGLTISGDASGDIPPEFWDHVEVVTGRKFTHRPTYFSCSC